MQVEGSVYPEKIKVKQYEKGMAHVLLRKNIAETQVTGEDGTTDTVYKYDEVEVVLANRANLTEYIEDNFDLVFNQGLAKENLPEEPSLEDRINAMEAALLESMGV
jgi:hypothetical protein